MFKVAVTVFPKNQPSRKIWDQVHMHLKGDMTNLENLITELTLVKQDINSDMQKKGIRFKDVDAKIEFLKQFED